MAESTGATSRLASLHEHAEHYTAVFPEDTETVWTTIQEI